MDSEEKNYKKCFEKCKSCFGPGNATNNNCRECQQGLIFLNETLFQSNCYEKCQYYYYFDEGNNYNYTENDKCSDEYNKLILEKINALMNAKKMIFIDMNITIVVLSNVQMELLMMKAIIFAILKILKILIRLIWIINIWIQIVIPN